MSIYFYRITGALAVAVAVGSVEAIISLVCGVVAGTSLCLAGLIADYTSIYWGFGILIMGKLVSGFLYSRLGKNYKD